MLTGIQFSIYFTSMWPYFTTLDPNADFSFFGWITSAYSIGQMISSWAFGYWNQKTMSARHPTSCGLAFMAFGNILYAFLYNVPSNQRWFMLFSRFLVGFGSGSIIVLRTYCAMSSLKKDRTKVMSLAVGSWVLGLSLGPAIQAMFTPIGKSGCVFLSIRFNMYTSPALLMVLISLISIILLIFCFSESYAGVVATNEQGVRGRFDVIPKYDRAAAISCIYLWFMLQSVATNIEVFVHCLFSFSFFYNNETFSIRNFKIATPFVISLYNWNDATAVFYNGILQFISCCINVVNYIVISYTRIGRMYVECIIGCKN
uniref:MFS domain-containing protein n=1 Tax=Ascaris lumbricoides TaxID=6252 RepID=A0A0M3INJ5_ASCLU